MATWATKDLPARLDVAQVCKLLGFTDTIFKVKKPKIQHTWGQFMPTRRLGHQTTTNAMPPQNLPMMKSPGWPIICFPRVDTCRDTMWSIGSKLKRS